MKKLVIFDLDGTLLDTLGDLADSVNFAITSCGYAEKTVEEVKSFIGNGTKKMIERALGDGADEQTVAACIAKFADYYKDHYNVKTRAYGGVHRCIDMLRKNGVRVGVVTNKLHDISVALCREHFGEVFDSVIGDLPGLARKPDPSKVKSMMAEFCCEQAIMVGDSDVDIKTAKNAGIPCVALSWGFNSRERLIAAAPEYIADTSDQLENILKELLSL